jgi:hypothetical protein
MEFGEPTTAQSGLAEVMLIRRAIPTARMTILEWRGHDHLPPGLKSPWHNSKGVVDGSRSSPAAAPSFFPGGCGSQRLGQHGLMERGKRGDDRDLGFISQRGR